ncbi:MAG: DUF4412 domain-containing protein [Cephaloticoccus sp.]|nr:DUF4412 domain-containing protein [Cephaloticoccus sp.]MCF7760000.1 DUF4412 domain-containing protein [Cephaloticoccus sp.]
MKTISRLLLLTTTLFLTSIVQAKNFEGTVQMQITGSDGGPHNLTYSIKNSHVRTDIQVSAGQSATAIMDLDKDEMIILMPGQPMYMTMAIKATVEKATGQKADESALENTGITTKILGYDCTKYLAKTKDGVIEIWATDQLGMFMGLGNMMGGKKAKSGWEQAITGKNFFPLRVVSAAKGANKFSLETTAIEPKSLPDSSFAPPPGYQKFDLGGMMQGMGGANPFGG